MKILEHKWFVTANKKLGELRRGTESAGEAFQAYTSTLHYKLDDDSD